MGSRKGFYLYDEKRKARPDPKIKTFIGKAREISGVNFDPKLVNLYEKNMLEMTFPMVNEACRVLAEGIVVKAADLDIAIVMARASHLTEPALGINFARDGMQEDWLALVAVHRDSWLLSVAFYFGSRFGFDKADRIEVDEAIAEAKSFEADRKELLTVLPQLGQIP